MSEKKSFEVYLIKKVPYVSFFLWRVLILLFAIIFLITLPMGLFKHSPPEMKVLYFMTLVPDFIKVILFYSSGLFILISFLYYNLKLKVKGVMVLDDRSIFLVSKSLTVEMKADEILKIHIFDPLNRHQLPKKRLELYFYLYKQVVKRVRLINYSESEMLANKLFKYEQIKFEVFQQNLLPDNYE